MPLITPVKENTMCNMPLFTGSFLLPVYSALLISSADWLPSSVR